MRSCIAFLRDDTAPFIRWVGCLCGIEEPISSILALEGKIMDHLQRFFSTPSF